jgi:hypothetical protein
MRIRTLKPEFWKHFHMAQLPPETRLLAIGLLNYADDEGYFRAHPALIRGELMPYTEKSSHIPKMLEALQSIGFLTLYITDQGEPMGHVTNFLEHQRINRPTASKHSRKTQPQLTETSVSAQLSLTDSSLLEREQGTGKGKGNGILSAPDGAGPNGDGAAKASADELEPGSGQKKKKGVAAREGIQPLAWSPETGWLGFTQDLWDEFALAYPACDIRRQMLAMEQWLKANPAKARKSNWRKFVTSWLVKEQDRGGDLRGMPQPAWSGLGAKNDGGSSKPLLTIEDAPAGHEQAMEALFGEQWREMCPAWPQMTASDKGQVRAWLRQHGKEAA